MNTVKVDIKDVKKDYPRSEWPCLEYCGKLLKEGIDENSRLEVWNYEREKPEADWIVENIGNYWKDRVNVKKRGVRLGFMHGRSRRVGTVR